MLLIPPMNLDANSETDPVSDLSRRTFLAGLGILLGSGLVAAPLMATAARWTEPPPVPRPTPSRAPTISRPQPRSEIITLNATILRYLGDLRRTGRLLSLIHI